MRQEEGEGEEGDGGCEADDKLCELVRRKCGTGMLMGSVLVLSLAREGDDQCAYTEENLDICVRSAARVLP